MTQEQIQERNAQIALMLGAIYSIHAEAWGFGNARIEPNELKFGNKIIKGAIWAERFEKELKFHLDYNWLMQAVEFIEELDNYFVQIEEKSCYVYDISKFDNSQTNAFIIKDGETKKEAVFIAVSDFAKIYNNKEL